MYFTYVFCINLLFLQVFFIVSRWQHTYFLCMYFAYVFVYTCFSCKYFSSLVDDNTHTSYACILHMFFVYTCFSCKYFSSLVDDNTHASYACILHMFFCIHLLFVQVFFIVRLWDYTSLLCLCFWSSEHGGYSDFLHLNFLELWCGRWYHPLQDVREILFGGCKLNSYLVIFSSLGQRPIFFLVLILAG